tara:strand:- start:512 stop:2281 length:1770 start_codon:yes stop_codon:yes gene_type:complete
VAGSNYEVNIKIDLKQAKTQLKALEERITKLNRMALSGKASRQAAQESKEKLKITNLELKNDLALLKVKQNELKLDKQSFQLEKQKTDQLSKQRNLEGGKALPGGSTTGGNRFAGAASSAIISGAFPLLFGQGPLVGAAGALGGGIGSLVGGQMGGFAGGLLATSLITPVQQFGIEASKLGQALNPATKDIKALTAALGITGTEFQKQIELLERLGEEEAAFEMARRKMINLVGKEGVASLEEFGKDTTDLVNSFSRLMTQMKAGFANLINSSGIFKSLTETIDRNVTIGKAKQNTNDDPILTAINNLITEKSTPGNFSKVKASFPQLTEMLVKRQKVLDIEDKITEAKDLQEKIAKATMKETTDEVAFLEKHRDLTAEMFAIEVKMRELEEKKIDFNREDFIANEMRLNQLQKQRQLAEESAAAFERMSQAIATDISQGIQGMIRGTSTLNDVLSNVLNKLIDASFNMAFFGNMQGSLGGGGGLFGSVLGMFGENKKKIPERAKGGPVQGGRSFVVGEKGPELFTPKSTGMITPNHALGGSTNVVVNVDASGSNVEGDEQGGRELGRLISAAVQSEIVQQQRPGGLLA